LIVVDASALVAIGALEPDFRRYAEALEQSDTAIVSHPNYVETGIILIGRDHLEDQAHLNAWLTSLDVAVWDGDGLATAALAAYLRFGRGFHPARLNLADVFAYALAKTLDVPLLYKGDDFAKTDIRSAL
jgi:ribonuclease VapC